MRVVVATDGVGELSAAQTGMAIARGWVPHEVAVIPVSAGGAGLAGATAHLTGGRTVDAGLRGRTGYRVDGERLRLVGLAGGAARTVLDPASTSTDLGRELLASASSCVARLGVDLTGYAAHDAGAGLLAALGATADRPLTRGIAPLAGTGKVDLQPARETLAGAELLGIVPTEELNDELLGLRGVTSRLGRTPGADPAQLLATDAALADFARAAAPGPAQLPGAGAAGGVAFSILALGGRLVSGPGLCAELAGLDHTLSLADLLVTACDSFNFGTRGGEVVRDLAARGERAGVPVLVLTPQLALSAREMRTFGVESAHRVEVGGAHATAGEADLTRSARRVAAGWTV